MEIRAIHLPQQQKDGRLNCVYQIRKRWDLNFWKNHKSVVNIALLTLNLKRRIGMNTFVCSSTFSITMFPTIGETGYSMAQPKICLKKIHDRNKTLWYLRTYMYSRQKCKRLVTLSTEGAVRSENLGSKLLITVLTPKAFDTW